MIEHNQSSSVAELPAKNLRDVSLSTLGTLMDQELQESQRPGIIGVINRLKNTQKVHLLYKAQIEVRENNYGPASQIFYEQAKKRRNALFDDLNGGDLTIPGLLSDYITTNVNQFAYFHSLAELTSILSINKGISRFIPFYRDGLKRKREERQATANTLLSKLGRQTHGSTIENVLEVVYK